MTVSQKQCPRCSTVAPLDATFCGQCGRQYRTQFVPPGNGSHSAAAPAPIYNAAVPDYAPRTRSVWMLRAAQGAVAALACVGVLAFSGVFRHEERGSVPAVVSAPAAPQTVAPPEPHGEIRKALREDPIESEARRVVDRESRKLDLPPPVGTDGKIHLRSGGAISREEWDAANRKAQDSPVMRHPPISPPF